jgi:hypothetical protein
MKYFDKYVLFVVGAKIAGYEIEFFNPILGEWVVMPNPKWNWMNCEYRIKLPSDWEYVIEDGEIAFREPRKGEYYLIGDISSAYIPMYQGSHSLERKFPIIKRKDTN